jgi:hypothetical protein
MNVEHMLKSPSLKKAAITFAAGYARRMMEGQYSRLMTTKVGKQALRLGKPSKYAVESVLNGVVAWLSTKEGKLANTPIREFLWDIAKDAPSEISKRLLNGEQVEAFQDEDKRGILDGLLSLHADDLKAFISWLEKASAEERHQMAAFMAVLTEAEQKKLLALSPEQVRTLFASTAASEQAGPPKSERAIRSLTSGLRALNERLEKRKGS